MYISYAWEKDDNDVIHEYESRIKDLEKLIYDYKEKIQDLISTLSQKDKVIKQKDARIAELQSKITELENASMKTAQQSSSSIVNDRYAPLMENNNMIVRLLGSCGCEQELTMFPAEAENPNYLYGGLEARTPILNHIRI